MSAGTTSNRVFWSMSWAFTGSPKHSCLCYEEDSSRRLRTCESPRKYSLAGIDSSGIRSTTFGSLTLAPAVHFMPAPAYKISKTALNALTVQYALDHAEEGFSFMAVCPGEGARASLEIIFQPNVQTNGQLLKVFVKGWENAQGINVYDGKIEASRWPKRLGVLGSRPTKGDVWHRSLHRKMSMAKKIIVTISVCDGILTLASFCPSHIVILVIGRPQPFMTQRDALDLTFAKPPKLNRNLCDEGWHRPSMKSQCLYKTRYLRSYSRKCRVVNGGFDHVF
nr:hypothetical protein CFP56_34654 [Quercus suber]